MRTAFDRGWPRSTARSASDNPELSTIRAVVHSRGDRRPRSRLGQVMQRGIALGEFLSFHGWSAPRAPLPAG
jgi:hypothetical protein